MGTLESGGLYDVNVFPNVRKLCFHPSDADSWFFAREISLLHANIEHVCFLLLRDEFEAKDIEFEKLSQIRIFEAHLDPRYNHTSNLSHIRDGLLKCQKLQKVILKGHVPPDEKLVGLVSSEIEVVIVR